jgi:cytochrome c-type biogenesis protein CcmH/NrfG
VHWATGEDDINLLGYDFMGSPGSFQLPVEHHYTEATAVFELNTRLYPESWNVWDSHGEALAALGHRDSAIMVYQRALKLNPGNPSSTAALERLRSTL